MTDSYKSNYKSMGFDQLLKVELPIWLTPKEREERLAYIASELRIKAR